MIQDAVQKESPAGEFDRGQCAGGTLLDQMYEARLKLRFMSVAISELWGSTHSEYGEDIAFGSQLLLHDIEMDLFLIHKKLDSSAPDIGGEL